MALYESLTSQSTPEQIAAAYQDFISGAGGDTAANQQAATSYLQNLGISSPTISAGLTASPLTVSTPTNAQTSVQQADTGALSQTSAPASGGFLGGAISNLTSQMQSSALPTTTQQAPITQTDVNKWFAEHPKATQQEIYQAVQSIGGLTPELASQIAASTGSNAQYVQQQYNLLNPITPTRAKQDWEPQYGTYNNAPIFSADVVDKNILSGSASSGVYKDPSYSAGANLNAASSFVKKGAELYGITPQYAYDENGDRSLTGYTGDLQGAAAKLGINTQGMSNDQIYDAVNNATKDNYVIGYVNPNNPQDGTQNNFQYATFKKVGDKLVATSAPTDYTGVVNPGGAPGGLAGIGSDIRGAIKDLGPIGQIALAAATSGMSLEAQIASNFAYNVAGGVPIEKALANAVAAYGGAQAVNSDVMKGITKELNAIDKTGTLASAARSATQGAITAGVTGNANILTGALAGATSGAVGQGVNYELSKMGLEGNALKSATAASTAYLRAKMMGMSDEAALNAAIVSGGTAGARSAVSAIKEGIKSGSIDTSGPMSGINLAGIDAGIMSDVGGGLPIEISGTPIFSEDTRSEKVSPPPGYALASKDDPVMSEPPQYDENDNLLPKSDGTYYDITQNAWFKPTGDFDLSAIEEAFRSQQGALPDDYLFTGDLSGSKSTSATSGVLPTDLGTIDVTGNRLPADVTPTDLGNLTITDKRTPSDVTPTDVGELTITDKRIPEDVTPEIVITDKRPVTPADTTTKTTTSTTPGTTTTPVTPKNLSTTTQVPSLTPQEMKFLEVKNPWLVTKRTPQKGVEQQQLKQLYEQLDPELQDVLSPRSSPKENDRLAAIKESLDPELAALLGIEGYAGGGIADSFSALTSFQKSMEDATPRFAKYISPGFLTLSGGKKSPIQMQELPQMQVGKKMAKGGLPSKYSEAAPDGHEPEFITGLTGYYAGGRGTGQSDDIPAMLHDGDYVIDAEAVSAFGDGSSKAGRDVLMHFLGQIPHKDGAQGKPVPAKIADGEVVLPESFVTALGGGDNKRGAQMLDEMRENLRQHKRSAPTSKIPPKAKSPLEYLKGVKG